MRAMSVGGLRGEIRELMLAMAQNDMELRRSQRQNLWLRANELLHARVEIYKSIAHRQGLIIEIQANELKFIGDGKVAA